MTDKTGTEKTILDQVMGYHFLKSKDVKARESNGVLYSKISKSGPEVGDRYDLNKF